MATQALIHCRGDYVYTMADDGSVRVFRIEPDGSPTQVQGPPGWEPVDN